AEVGGLYDEMASGARSTLSVEGVPDARVELAFSADLRYVGQFNEVEVPSLDGTGVDADVLEAMVGAFHDRHDTLYGYSMPGAPVELINLRVSARGLTEKPRFARTDYGGEDPSAAYKTDRRAYLDGEFIDVPVFD